MVVSFFFFSSRRRHTRWNYDWSSDVCSSDLTDLVAHVQEGFRNKIARETPMGRNASPVDVARAVLFLASSLASFTTGQKLRSEERRVGKERQQREAPDQ